MELSNNYEELTFFQRYDENVLSEFIEIAYEYLVNKNKHKSYSNAALKLNVECFAIEKLIGKLSDLLLESAKLTITEAEFVSNLQPILFDKVHLLWEQVFLKRNLLKEMLTKTEINYAHFSSLNWRLENTIASKSLESCENTHFLMEIQLKNRDDKEQRHFITDIPNIFHFTNVLESALNETKTSHIRRGPTSN
ncbi:uncharacterized protein LOC124321123 [Daphnia pulicaria]|uniref:uncharacterized protein LOC124321123 n=1 Tax=Daphnia pulicaria TaxID=35523 RepID=UPI001EEC7849|nr:uncharacterized protein LOC124321123 [Daphnia pulicaria]